MLYHIKRDSLDVLGYIISIRAILLGLSFAANRPDAVVSVLYRHIDQFPLVEPEVFGTVLMISGLITFTGFLMKNTRLVRYSSQFQFMVYLFATFIYFLNGSFISGLIAAAIPAALTYVVAYRFCNRKTIQEQRREWGLPPR
jgi:uncharacterized protein (DUF2062 family)